MTTALHDPFIESSLMIVVRPVLECRAVKVAINIKSGDTNAFDFLDFACVVYVYPNP
jgi:hypothetical protein